MATKNPSFLNTDFLIRQVDKQGFKLFTDSRKPFNLNLIGIRTASQQVDTFDDWMAVLWHYNGAWNSLFFQQTTDPGLYYLGPERMGNESGTFLLKDQYQHFGLWKLGFHHGRHGHPCLRQKGPAIGWRDHNRDNKINPDKDHTYHGQGINCHRAKAEGKTERVGPYSSGCQVFENANEHRDVFIPICKQAASFWGDSFSYLLLNEQFFI